VISSRHKSPSPATLDSLTSDCPELRILSAERAALRRLASLVGGAAEPTRLCAAMARELRQILGADAARIVREQPGGAATVVASDGWAFDELPAKLTTRIVVDGRIWGEAAAAWRRPTLSAADFEWQVAPFSELLAIAIANAQTRAELMKLRDELRHTTPSVAAAERSRWLCREAASDGPRRRHLGEMLDPRDRAGIEEWGSGG
jgi:GAF domain-containing protein